MESNGVAITSSGEEVAPFSLGEITKPTVQETPRQDQDQERTAQKADGGAGGEESGTAGGAAGGQADRQRTALRRPTGRRENTSTGSTPYASCHGSQSDAPKGQERAKSPVIPWLAIQDPSDIHSPGRPRRPPPNTTAISASRRRNEHGQHAG